MTISRGVIVQAVIDGLRERRGKYIASKKITPSEYVDSLIWGYYALKYESPYSGIAEQLKPEFREFRRHLPDWMLYYFGWKKDYDLSDYDTGDIVEIAFKILTGWTMSKNVIKGGKLRYGQRIYVEEDFRNIFEISKFMVEDTINDFNDIDDLKPAIQWLNILSWTEYFVNDVNEIYDQLVSKLHGTDDSWVRVTLFGDKNRAENVLYKDYKAWIIWRGAVR